MPITRATNLAGLGTVFDGSGLIITGITTTVDLNATRVNVSGVGTITNGSITNLTGTAGTVTTLRSTTLNADTGNIVTGVTTNFTSTNVVISGVATAAAGRFVQSNRGAVNITHSTVGSLPLVTSIITESDIDLVLGTTYAENMRVVASTGKVGIATTTPISSLSVNGDISITGNNNIFLDSKFGENENGSSTSPYIGWGSNGISRITGNSPGTGLGFLAFLPGGMEAMRLRRNNAVNLTDVSVGIATTNPRNNARLQIGPSNTAVFIVDNTGRVGLGTTAFGENVKMSVLHSHAANYNPFEVIGHNQFGNTTSYLSFPNNYTGIYLGGSFFSNSGGGVISGIRDGGSNNEGVIVIAPTDANGTPVERFRVNHLGNVGIGTTNIASTISPNVANLTLGSKSSSVSGGIIYQTTGATAKAYHYYDSDRLIHQSTKRHAFLVNNSTIGMLINESGDTEIGIGGTAGWGQYPLSVTTNNYSSTTDTSHGGIYSYNGAQFYTTYIAGGNDNGQQCATVFIMPCTTTPTPFGGTVSMVGNTTSGGTVRASLYLIKGEVITTAGTAAVQNTTVTGVAGDTGSTSCSISATSLSSGNFIALSVRINSGSGTNQSALGVYLTNYLAFRRATRTA